MFGGGVTNRGLGTHFNDVTRGQFYPQTLQDAGLDRAVDHLASVFMAKRFNILVYSLIPFDVNKTTIQISKSS